MILYSSDLITKWNFKATLDFTSQVQYQLFYIIPSRQIVEYICKTTIIYNYNIFMRDRPA